MKHLKSKSIVCIVMTLMMILGAAFIGGKSTAKAADLSIDERVLSVKCQLSPDMKNLRIVTTLDDHKKYENLGFEVEFLADDTEAARKIDHKVSTVYRKIVSTLAGSEYTFDAKVFNADSEWFGTIVIKNIPEGYRDNGIVIKPYISEANSSKRVYGQSRYLKLNDYDNNVVSMPVKGELANPEISGETLVDSYYDGLYTHVRVNKSYSTLPSLSTYTVTDGEDTYTASYRNLYTKIAKDTSWYTESADDDKVIASANELAGFQELSKTEDFAGKTIYLGSDIDLNPGWKASTLLAPGTSGGRHGSWIPIGQYGNISVAPNQDYKPFAGTFDGDMHTIQGLYIDGNGDASTLKNRMGLFGVTAESCEIKNLIIKNSFLRSMEQSYSTSRAGAIAGVLNGTVDTVKIEEDVIVRGRGMRVGGIAGEVGNATIKNCLVACRVGASTVTTSDATEKGTANIRRRGGLVGGLNESGNTCTISNCLFTGIIETGNGAGGFVGYTISGSTLNINNSLFAGCFYDVATAVTTNRGTVIGQRSGTANMTNVYACNDEIVSKVIGNTDSASGITSLDKETDLTDEAAYLNLDFDFYVEGHEDGVWVAVEASTPSLKAFTTDGIIDISKIQGNRTLWYKPTAGQDTYVLYSAADFKGFQEKAQTDSFEGDIVKLGADIDLNPGWDAMTGEAPEVTSEPIGKYGSSTGTLSTKWTRPAFAGTFDGQMHSISGLYINAGGTRTGLFGEITVASTVKNLTLKNSYIMNTHSVGSIARVGGIVGQVNGTIDTVKCESDVVVTAQAKEIGGIAGSSTDGVINNCWFAGTLGTTSTNATQRDRGGILGGIYTTGSDSATITNCLVTGHIVKTSYVGGIAGPVYGAGSITIKNSLFAGTLDDGTGTANIGLVCGGLAETKTQTFTYENVYALGSNGITQFVGKESATSTGMTLIADDATISGNAAYAVMNVDFYVPEGNQEGAWITVKDGIPALAAFTDKADYADVSTVQGTRTFWYDNDTTKSEYTLYSPADFRGFQALSVSNDFAGVTIKLGADIDLNPGWIPSVGTYNAGTNGSSPNGSISPIGYVNATTKKAFAGAFDGQMHSISGVRMAKWGAEQKYGLFAQTTEDSVVKNFVLKNSYFYISSSADKQYTGSVVGVLGGTLDTVKCDDTVVVYIEKPKASSGTQVNAEYCGGMVGTAKKGVINNCWFAGTITGQYTNHLGGLLGGIFTSGDECVVTNCLVTGTIGVGSNTGGIVGTVWTGTMLDISDCLFAGTFVNNLVSNSSQPGNIFGHINNTTAETLSVTNVYAVKNTHSCTGTVREGASSGNGKVSIPVLEKGKLYLGDALENTNLPIYPEGMDTSDDGAIKEYWWYTTENIPVLASFGTPVAYDMLKIATYNIGSCYKLWDSYSISASTVLSEIAGFISQNDFDIVCLNEVDNNCARSGRVNQAEELVAVLNSTYGKDYQAYFSPALKGYTGGQGYVGEYGNAIIFKSQYTLKSSDSIMIQHYSEQVKHLSEMSEAAQWRVLTKVVLDVNGRDTAVLCTHLDTQEYSEITHPVALDVIKNTVNTIKEESANTSIIFAGDMNSRPTDNTITEISSVLKSTTAGRFANTLPVANPDSQFDYIFTSNHFTNGWANVLDPMGTSGDALDKRLSDHRPLTVNLYIK